MISFRANEAGAFCKTCSFLHLAFSCIQLLCLGLNAGWSQRTGRREAGLSRGICKLFCAGHCAKPLSELEGRTHSNKVDEIETAGPQKISIYSKQETKRQRSKEDTTERSGKLFLENHLSQLSTKR